MSSWPAKPDWMCQYYFLCDNPAEGIVKLPFGDIPTCQRCADKMEQILEPYEEGPALPRTTWACDTCDFLSEHESLHYINGVPSDICPGNRVRA